MRYPRKAIIFGMAAACFGLACLAGPRLAEAGGMGIGMIGPGMMASPDTTGELSPVRVKPARAKALLSYIHDQSRACLKCHAVLGGELRPILCVDRRKLFRPGRWRTGLPHILRTASAAWRRGWPAGTSGTACQADSDSGIACDIQTMIVSANIPDDRYLLRKSERWGERSSRVEP